VKRVPVASEALRSVGYEAGTLELEFADGDVYRYFDVPEAEYAALMLSESMGRYVVENIREGYRYVRV
jgi:hypothetical protein